MLSSGEMKRVEDRAEDLGIKPELMMENAGRSVVEILKDRINLKNKDVAIVCGTGNDGGDGFCIARHLLCEDSTVEIFLYGKPEKINSEEASLNWNIIKSLDIEITILENRDEIPSFENFDLILDSILGTGIIGELRGFLPTLVSKMNSTDNFKVAIDVPTGINSDTGEVLDNHFKPDLTITMHESKPGLSENKCGEIIVGSIGVPKYL